MKIVLFGGPGAGKGTQAKKIVAKYGISVLATGDLLRQEVVNESEIGLLVKDLIKAGKLAPDDLVINMVKKELKKPDYSKGYVMDGFPRTLKQAKELEGFEKLDTVLFINVPFEDLVKRLSGRRICPKCGKIYHLVFLPPEKDEKCSCGADLIQREDDKEEAVKKRIETYQERTQPLIDFYKQKDLLKEIDGTGSIEEVFKDISGFLDELK